MRFSEWLETKLAEVLNPELDRLKKDEKQLIMSMEMRKDPMGRVLGINKGGYIAAAEELKKVRARIRELGGEAVREGRLYDEDFQGSFKKQFASQYQQSKQGSEQDYSRYADAAQKALSKAGEVAKNLSQKTGVPLPLATALIAAGATGGPTAVPFAALLYFVKQPLMKGANRAFDATWDAGANAVQVGQRMLGGQQQPKLQPEALIHPGSFEEFLEANSWGDWAGERLGGLAGRAAGNVAGFGGKIGGALKNRIKEITQYAKNNPKEVARMAFLVGAGAAIGAGVGKITHDIKDLIVQKIKDQGIDPQVLDWVKKNIVLDGEGKTSSGQALTSQDGKEVDHPYHINPEGHKVYGNITLGGDTKMMQNMGSNDLKPSDLHGQGTGLGRTSYSSSTGGSQNLTSVTVPNSPDLRDTYRDAARVLQGKYKPGILGGMFGGDADRGDATNAMIQSSATPLWARVDMGNYGHSAGEEISKSLGDAAKRFSPDTYTTSAAVAGGVVGGTGSNNPRKRSRA